MVEGAMRHGTDDDRSRPTTPIPKGLLLHGHLMSCLSHWHQESTG